MTFVSVVIPARNDAAMLATCLDALARQTRPADEIVVVDNGSSDATAAIAAAAGARVVTEPIPGIPRASSAGYDAARGDLVARIDADSVCPPGWLAQAIAAFEKDPAALGAHRHRRVLRLERARALDRTQGLPRRDVRVRDRLPLPSADLRLELHDAPRGLERAPGRGAPHRAQHPRRPRPQPAPPAVDARRVRPDLVVAISARPFESWTSLKRRLSWVIPTVRKHWPEESPWNRRIARRRWREEQRGSAPRCRLEALVASESAGVDLRVQRQQVARELMRGRLARAVTGVVDGQLRADPLRERGVAVRPARGRARR